MINLIIAWRAEIIGVLTLAATWWFFHYRLRQSFWLVWVPGALLGLANEFATEPEWTYSLQLYIWRDVSPIVIMGWGIVFAWLVTLSDKLYQKIFGADPYQPGLKFWRLVLTDIAVGVPLLLSNELLGLHVLKVWKYNEILGWNTLLPIIHYPAEGLFSLFCFVIAVPNAIRFWKRLGHL